MKKLLSALFLTLLCTPALAEPLPRTISVIGQAREQIAPDQAILSVSLTSKDVSLTIAKQRGDALVEKLINIAKQFDVPKDKIATSNINISPEYRYDNTTGKQSFVAYNVNRQLRVTIDALPSYERIIAAMVDAKIDQVNNVEFRISKPEEVNARLRLAAFEDAKAKAQALAQAAGAKLGPAVVITTEGATPPLHPRPMYAMAKMADSATSSAEPLPGMMELSETVNVTFGLE